MKIPSPEEIESAIEKLSKFFDEAEYQASNLGGITLDTKYFRVAFNILRAYQSGELVKPASEEKIGNIISKECWQNIDKDLKLSKDWIKNVAKALSGKVGELVGKEEVKELQRKLKNALDSWGKSAAGCLFLIEERDTLKKQLQSKYMSVEEVEKIVYDLLLKTGSSSYHLKDDSKAIAQALTRLPKGEI